MNIKQQPLVKEKYGPLCLKVFAGAIIFCLLVPFTVFAQETRDEVFYYQKGREALEENQTAAAVKHFLKADSLRPNHPVIMQYVSLACAQNHERDCAVAYLRKLGMINADESLLEHKAFDAIRTSPAFKEVAGLYARMNKTVSASDTAFTIPEKDLHPESVVYHESTGTFYISSIHKRKIIKRTRDGRFIDFASKGLQAVSGLTIDARRGFLWAASPSTPQMTGYEPSEDGISYVFKLDLETGEILNFHAAPDTNKHFFGDLIVHPNGNVFVTDSYYPALYRISAQNGKMELFKHFEGLRSLQGLALNPARTSLYVADYVQGIFKIDIADKKVIHLQPDGISLKGIDGLYYYKQSLIAIQNGVRPMRITRLYLSGDGDRITAFRYLEKNNPALDEPTLGAIAGNTFYYVANSPWGKYKQDGTMLAQSELDEGLILKISLED